MLILLKEKNGGEEEKLTSLRAIQVIKLTGLGDISQVMASLNPLMTSLFPQSPNSKEAVQTPHDLD